MFYSRHCHYPIGIASRFFTTALHIVTIATLAPVREKNGMFSGHAAKLRKTDQSKMGRWGRMLLGFNSYGHSLNSYHSLNRTFLYLLGGVQRDRKTWLPSAGFCVWSKTGPKPPCTRQSLAPGPSCQEPGARKVQQKTGSGLGASPSPERFNHHSEQPLCKV